jgi:hypothetical protein
MDLPTTITPVNELPAASIIQYALISGYLYIECPSVYNLFSVVELL